MIIKKLNVMFHKHSRWLFGIFTLVIIVSFLGFLTPGQFGCDGSGMDRAVGEAFGRKVTFNDLQVQRRQIGVLAALGMGRSNDSIEFAFFRHCQMKAAERLGLAVSDKEIAELMRELPFFQEGGKFTRAKYDETMNALRKHQGVTEEMFVEALRGALLQEKLGRAIAADVAVTPNEVETLYRQLNVRYEIRAVDFTAESFLKDVKSDGEAVKAYFAANQAQYRIPGSFTALIAEFPYAEYAKQAAPLANDAAVKQYFEANPAVFAKFGKEGKEPKFEDCKAEAKKELLQALTRDFAMQKAHDFAGKAYEQIESAAQAKHIELFKAEAARAKSKVSESGTVAMTATSIGKIDSPVLVRTLAAAFDSSPVTNAVAGDEAAYVGLALVRNQERAASFEEVSVQVLGDYRDSEARKLARAAADKAEEAILAAAAGAERDKVFNGLKNCNAKTFPVVLGSEMPPQEYMYSAQAATELAPGEFTAVIDTGRGSQIAKLIKRIPADMKEFESKKQQTEMIARYQKMQSAQAAFMEDLDAQCKLNAEYNRSN